jgi:hypothetical protein
LPWREGADTIEPSAAQLLVGFGENAGIGLGDAFIKGLETDRGGSDPGADSTHPIVSKVAAAMRDCDEDNAMHGSFGFPFKGFFEASAVFYGQFESFVGHFESGIPKDIAGSDHKGLAN